MENNEIVLKIELDCLDLLNVMNETLKQARLNFEEYDNSEDMYMIDQMYTAIDYMNEMLEKIRKYKS